MGKLQLKYGQLLDSLERVLESIEDFELAAKECHRLSSDKAERKYRSYRDSLIKRFEFTVDQFWKYIRRYLEDELKQVVDVASPKPVIRLAVKAKLLSEVDGRTILEMIDCRNMTSHMYKEEIAETISSEVAQYYEVMKKYVDKLVPTVD